MKTVNKLDYIYRQLVVKAREQHNDIVEISDEEYAKYYEVEPEPVEPTPGSDIPIPGEEDPGHDYSQDYLTFEALEDGTFSFTTNDLYYSTNNGVSWKSLAAGTNTELITKGTKVLWKKDSSMINNATNSYNSTVHSGIGTFSSSCKFNVSGNILSLAIDTFKTQVLGNSLFWGYYFKSLFENCINIISAQNLILPNKDFSAYQDNGGYGGYCFTGIYSFMFKNCSNLIYGPKILPATIICNSCYKEMFYGCTNLLESPILSALNISGEQNYYCYQSMFNGCISLKKLTMLAINIGNIALSDWVKDVLPGGVFIKNSKSTFDNIGPSGIPAGWEVIDEEVPEEGE